MPNDVTSNPRKRMVVEEVADNAVAVPEMAPTPPPVEETAPAQVVQTPPSIIQELPEAKVSDSSNITWILIPGILLLGALLGGIIFYQNKVNNIVEPTSTPTSSATAIPDATPTPTVSTENVDLEKYTLVLQNGSGIKGEATKVKDLLVKAGFKVGTTGNASSFDYTNTIVQVKADTDAGFLAKLKEVLGENYKIGKDEVLKSTSKDNIVIVIGSSKN